LPPRTRASPGRAAPTTGDAPRRRRVASAGGGEEPLCGSVSNGRSRMAKTTPASTMTGSSLVRCSRGRMMATAIRTRSSAWRSTIDRATASPPVAAAKASGDSSRRRSRPRAPDSARLRPTRHIDRTAQPEAGRDHDLRHRRRTSSSRSRHTRNCHRGGCPRRSPHRPSGLYGESRGRRLGDRGTQAQSESGLLAAVLPSSIVSRVGCSRPTAPAMPAVRTAVPSR